MKHSRAFTLIEMLVVMAIIGLLAALLLPAINGVRRHAKVVSARTEVRQLAAAWKQYYSAYERWPSADLLGDSELPVRISGDVARLLLSATDVNDSEGRSQNPKHLRFVEFPRVNNDGDPVSPWVDADSEEPPSELDYYYAMLDIGYDNRLMADDSTGGDWPGDEVLTNDVRKTVIVWTVNRDPDVQEGDENYILGSWQ